MSFIFKYRGGDTRPTPGMIKTAARRLGITVPVMEAVIDVEASGKWYRNDGTMVRRFEPHHVPKSMQRALGFSGGWRAALKIRTTTRRRMFEQAYHMDPEAACSASSWGAFQIMGFNAKRAGFSSAVAMVRAFENSIESQLDAFVNFVKFIGADGDLRAQDWYQFARKYNGSGQPGVYAKKLRSAYARRTGGGSPRVLSIGASGASVRELQKALATRGYAVEVDGVFGAETLEAVRDFQHTQSLTVDGKVGAMTWAALRKTAAHSPRPELEPTESESFSEKVSGAAGATTAATGGVTALLGDSPSDTVRIALIGAMGVLAAVALFFYLKKKSEKKNRLSTYRMQNIEYDSYR